MGLLFIIGIGGFFGAICRFLLSGWMQPDSAFPLGTLGVNVMGSFLLGLIMYLSEFGGMFSEETRVLLTIGVLGSFTTMSAFSYESFKLMEQNEWLYLAANVGGTLILTILAVYLGRLAALTLGRAIG